MNRKNLIKRKKRLAFQSWCIEWCTWRCMRCQQLWQVYDCNPVGDVGSWKAFEKFAESFCCKHSPHTRFAKVSLNTSKGTPFWHWTIKSKRLKRCFRIVTCLFNEQCTEDVKHFEKHSPDFHQKSFKSFDLRTRNDSIVTIHTGIHKMGTWKIPHHYYICGCTS